MQRQGVQSMPTTSYALEIKTRAIPPPRLISPTHRSTYHGQVKCPFQGYEQYGVWREIPRHLWGMVKGKKKKKKRKKRRKKIDINERCCSTTAKYHHAFAPFNLIMTDLTCDWIHGFCTLTCDDVWYHTKTMKGWQIEKNMRRRQYSNIHNRDFFPFKCCSHMNLR